MHKAVFMLSRADGLSHDEFVEYWEETHAPIAQELPNLSRYTVCPAADPESASHDGIAELGFETKDDLFVALDSEEFSRVQKDAAEFSDPDEVVFVVVEERMQTIESE